MNVAASARACEEAGVACWPEAGEKAARLGFAHRRPFLLGFDGGYDHRLNAFFGACSTLGVRSPDSQKAYAYDLVAFARFLAASGKTVWDADRHDIDRYFDHRCGEAAPEPLSLAAEAGVSRRTAARATGVLRDFRDALEGLGEPASPAGTGEAGPLREELAEARAKLAERNAEVRRLRADLAALACRVALISEENAQLRGDRAGTVVALPARAAR